MSRRRRSHSAVIEAQTSAPATVTHHISPALVRQDLLWVAAIYLSLLVLLGLTAYWQHRSGVPTQIGHAMRLFLGF